MTMTLFPYLLFDNAWVFDDKTTGLKSEAFVKGMSEMISRMIEAKGIPNAAQGFAMTFSDEPFDHDVELHWLRADDPETPMSGNWYTGNIAGQEMKGWLCPALLCYFTKPPARLFVRADPLPAGIDPIWRDFDGSGRRFMGPEDE